MEAGERSAKPRGCGGGGLGVDAISPPPPPPLPLHSSPSPAAHAAAELADSLRRSDESRRRGQVGPRGMAYSSSSSDPPPVNANVTPMTNVSILPPPSPEMMTTMVSPPPPPPDSTAADPDPAGGMVKAAASPEATGVVGGDSDGRISPSRGSGRRRRRGVGNHAGGEVSSSRSRLHLVPVASSVPGVHSRLSHRCPPSEREGDDGEARRGRQRGVSDEGSDPDVGTGHPPPDPSAIRHRPVICMDAFPVQRLHHGDDGDRDGEGEVDSSSSSPRSTSLALAIGTTRGDLLVLDEGDDDEGATANTTTAYRIAPLEDCHQHDDDGNSRGDVSVVENSAPDDGHPPEAASAVVVRPRFESVTCVRSLGNAGGARLVLMPQPSRSVLLATLPMPSSFEGSSSSSSPPGALSPRGRDVVPRPVPLMEVPRSGGEGDDDGDGDGPGGIVSCLSTHGFGVRVAIPSSLPLPSSGADGGGSSGAMVGGDGWTMVENRSDDDGLGPVFDVELLLHLVLYGDDEGTVRLCCLADVVTGGRSTRRADSAGDDDGPNKWWSCHGAWSRRVAPMDSGGDEGGGRGESRLSAVEFLPGLLSLGRGGGGLPASERAAASGCFATAAFGGGGGGNPTVRIWRYHVQVVAVHGEDEIMHNNINSISADKSDGRIRVRVRVWAEPLRTLNVPGGGADDSHVRVTSLCGFGSSGGGLRYSPLLNGVGLCAGTSGGTLYLWGRRTGGNGVGVGIERRDGWSRFAEKDDKEDSLPRDDEVIDSWVLMSAYDHAQGAAVTCVGGCGPLSAQITGGGKHGEAAAGGCAAAGLILAGDARGVVRLYRPSPAPEPSACSSCSSSFSSSTPPLRMVARVQLSGDAPCSSIVVVDDVSGGSTLHRGRLILVASGGGEVRRWDERSLPLSPPMPSTPPEPEPESGTVSASAPSSESRHRGDDEEGGRTSKGTTTSCQPSRSLGQGEVVDGAASPPGPSRDEGPDAVIVDESSSATDGGDEVRQNTNEKHGGDDGDGDDRPPEPRRVVPVPIDVSAPARPSSVGGAFPHPHTHGNVGSGSVGEMPPQPRRYADHVPVPSSPPPRPRPRPPQPHPHPAAEAHQSNGPPRMFTNARAPVGVEVASPPTSTDGSAAPASTRMRGRPVGVGGSSERHRHRRDDPSVLHDEWTMEAGNTGRQRPPLSTEDGEYEEYLAPHPLSAPVLNSSLHEYEYNRRRLEETMAVGAANVSANFPAGIDDEHDHRGFDSRQQHHLGGGMARGYNDDTLGRRDDEVGRRRRAAAAANAAVNVRKEAVLYPDLVPLDREGEKGAKKAVSQSKLKVKKGVSEAYLKNLEATAPTLEDLWPDDAEPIIEMPPPPDMNDSFFERLGKKIRNEASLAEYLYPGELSSRIDPY